VGDPRTGGPAGLDQRPATGSATSASSSGRPRVSTPSSPTAAREEPEQHQPARARGERRGQPEDREHGDGEDEAPPRADPVGRGAPEPGAEQHADEARRREQAAGHGVEPELGTDRRQREAHQEHLGGAGRPRHPADGRQPPLERPYPTSSIASCTVAVALVTPGGSPCVAGTHHVHNRRKIGHDASCCAW